MCANPARWLTVAIVVFTFMVEVAAAEPPFERPRRSKNQTAEGRVGKDKAEEEKPKPLPNDPRLLKLHQNFVLQAERLAGEYEKNKEFDKAKAAYEEILKLVPEYPNAQNKLQEILAREAVAGTKQFDVWANKDWQDTGVDLIEGKPIQIEVKGDWTFKMSHRLGPDGMEIPEVLKDFPLGSLIAVIVKANPNDVEPFLVGTGMNFIAPRSGRLLLRMHDSDVGDNEGKLSVRIIGSFNDANRAAK